MAGPLPGPGLALSSSSGRWLIVPPKSAPGLLYGAETAAHLQRAVDSRDLIGQAKGILMEPFKVDDEDAFRMLVKSSQDTNLKPTAVASWLTREVRVPASTAPPAR